MREAVKNKTIWAGIRILVILSALLLRNLYYLSGQPCRGLHHRLPGLNLLFGFTGLVSIGHAAFFGTGAYTTAILLTRIPAIPFPVILFLLDFLRLCSGSSWGFRR